MKQILISTILTGGVLSPLAFGAGPEDVSGLVEAGRFDEAKSILAEMKEPVRYLWEGRIAFMNYDFDEAQRLYGQYRKALGKGTPAPESSLFNRQLTLARQALESVAEIEVIDSITVPTSSFLSAFRLPPSAGRLAEPDEIPAEGRAEIASSVFFNERGDFALWAEPDTTGTYRITEATRLVDGTWSEPRMATNLLNNGGDTDYPFMCADGTTLYYSADGEDSLGGFDIYLATRDASDGSYLKPRNLGMPFNSPYDDFMMVIDEENGVGWWATDRNLIPDRLTVYVYKLADSRTNIDPDDEDLIALARLSDISLTQDPEGDYKPLLRRLAGVSQGKPRKPVEFHLYIPGRGVLTSYGDLRSSEGRRLIKEYQTALAKADKDKARLAELRRKYREAVGSGGRKALSTEILELEKREEETRTAIKELRNKIISAERG